jgi:Predicted metal-dependent phosphoesterases (PHP family)
MFYDLHIHSALSPCAADDMTPNNIVNMAILKGLDLIAITDHNTIGQLEAIDKVVKNSKIDLIFGLEVQTIEEVHVLCYFQEFHQVQAFYEAMKPHWILVKNDEDYFGKQLLFDENDAIVGKVEDLLLTSIYWSLEEVEKQVHHFGGAFVLAHVMDRLNSVTTQLGFIPKHLRFDGIEIHNEEQKLECLALNPWIEDTIWLNSSDAHQLIDIHEAQYQIDKQTLKKLWRI